MKKSVSAAALLLAAVSLSAVPSTYKEYDDGWLSMGIGASVTIPDGRLSLLFEFDVGGPEQIGMSISLMFGDRWLFTMGVFYFIDPTPDSIYAIPVVLKGGVIDFGLFTGGDIRFGLALSTGIKLYPLVLVAGDAVDPGMHLTGDLQGTVYWDFSRLEFSIDAWPAIQFGLVDDTGYYYY